MLTRRRRLAAVKRARHCALAVTELGRKLRVHKLPRLAWIHIHGVHHHLHLVLLGLSKLGSALRLTCLARRIAAAKVVLTHTIVNLVMHVVEHLLLLLVLHEEGVRRHG